jgi:hypothetical protein
MSKASMGESPRTVDRNRGQTEGGSESEGGRVPGLDHTVDTCRSDRGSLQMEGAEDGSQEMTLGEKTRKDWRDSGGLIRSRR